MKILKIVLYSIIGIVALVLLAALFVKKEYEVKREIVINKSQKEVFDYLKMLQNQDHFSVWVMKDPAMKKEYKGTDGTMGFTASWDSNMKDVGKGSQEIIGIEEGKRIDYTLRFLKPFENTAHAAMVLSSKDSTQTTVTWSFDSKMPYPMNLMKLFCDIDAMLGKSLQTGLDNLKAILEK